MIFVMGEVREEATEMTVEKILELGLIDDDTEILIRDEDSRVLAHGNWYQDNVLAYGSRYVQSFTWQDDNKCFIDIK